MCHWRQDQDDDPDPLVAASTGQPGGVDQNEDDDMVALNPWSPAEVVFREVLNLYYKTNHCVLDFTAAPNLALACCRQNVKCVVLCHGLQHIEVLRSSVTLRILYELLTGRGDSFTTRFLTRAASLSGESEMSSAATLVKAATETTAKHPNPAASPPPASEAAVSVSTTGKDGAAANGTGEDDDDDMEGDLLDI
jgi:hypothetical protein